jgi:peroxiredoxin
VRKTLILFAAFALALSAWASAPPGPKQAADFRLADRKGKVVILEIGNVGCPISEKGFAELEKLSLSQLKAANVVFVNAAGNEAALKAFLEKQAPSFDVYYDPKREIAGQLDYRIIPTFYLIDKWGTIRYKGAWKTAQMDPAVTALLAENKPLNASLEFMASLKTGDTAPQFSLPGQAGKTIDLKTSLKDSRLLLLLFGNEWCPYSRKAYEQIDSLTRKFGPTGLRIVTVHVGQYGDNVKAYYNSLKLSCPIALDTDEKVADAYGVDAVPTVFLIDPGAKIRFRGLFDPQTENAIATHLASKGAEGSAGNQGRSVVLATPRPAPAAATSTPATTSRGGG